MWNDHDDEAPAEHFAIVVPVPMMTRWKMLNRTTPSKRLADGQTRDPIDEAASMRGMTDGGV